MYVVYVLYVLYVLFVLFVVFPGSAALRMAQNAAPSGAAAGKTKKAGDPKVLRPDRME